MQVKCLSSLKEIYVLVLYIKIEIEFNVDQSSLFFWKSRGNEMLDETSFTDRCVECISRKLCNPVGFYQHGYSIVGVELLAK